MSHRGVLVDVGFAAGNLSVKDTEQNRQNNGFAGCSITAHRTYSRWYHRSEGNVFLLIERCSMNLNGNKQLFTDVFHKTEHQNHNNTPYRKIYLSESRKIIIGTSIAFGYQFGLKGTIKNEKCKWWNFWKYNLINYSNTVFQTAGFRGFLSRSILLTSEKHRNPSVCAKTGVQDSMIK